MKVLISLLVMFLAIALIGGCSGMTITEDYSQSPAKAMSVGEGRHTYNFHYQGKSYILVKGRDGRYYALSGSTTDPLEKAMQRMNMEASNE